MSKLDVKGTGYKFNQTNITISMTSRIYNYYKSITYIVGAQSEKHG